MSKDDIRYLTLREREERQRASDSVDAGVASLHTRFADEYQRRLAILRAGEPMTFDLWNLRLVS